MAEVEWYAYGSLKAPKFPTLEEFPYMHLRAYKSTSYYLYYSNKPCYWTSGKNYAFRENAEGAYIYFNPNTAFDGWTIDSEYKVNTGEQLKPSWGGMSGDTIWANFDIYSYSDGTTLFYQAQEPVLWDSVSDISINCPDSVARGLFIGISAMVTGVGDYNSDYTLTLSGQGANSNPIDATTLYRNATGDSTVYQLFCSKTEASESLTLTAASVANPSVTATKTIAVTGDIDDGSGGDSGGDSGDSGETGGGGVDTSGVTDIQITMFPDTVCPGGHALFEVLVSGTGNFNSDYTLELHGQESADTFVVEGRGIGDIWVAEDETADFVLLTATSVEEPLIQSSEMLYIDHETVEEPAATSEQLQRAFMQGYAAARAYLGKLKIVEGTMLSVDQTNTEEAPEDIPSQLKRSFWKGFMAGVGSLAGKGQTSGPDAILHDGVLYILKAKANMNEGILEVT